LLFGYLFFLIRFLVRFCGAKSINLVPLRNLTLDNRTPHSLELLLEPTPVMLMLGKATPCTSTSSKYLYNNVCNVLLNSTWIVINALKRVPIAGMPTTDAVALPRAAANSCSCSTKLHSRQFLASWHWQKGCLKSDQVFHCTGRYHFLHRQA
jgi:hypothetical protein